MAGSLQRGWVMGHPACSLAGDLPPWPLGTASDSAVSLPFWKEHQLNRAPSSTSGPCSTAHASQLGGQGPSSSPRPGPCRTAVQLLGRSRGPWSLTALLLLQASVTPGPLDLPSSTLGLLPGTPNLGQGWICRARSRPQLGILRPRREIVTSSVAQPQASSPRAPSRPSQNAPFDSVKGRHPCMLKVGGDSLSAGQHAHGCPHLPRPLGHGPGSSHGRTCPGSAQRAVG